MSHDTSSRVARPLPLCRTCGYDLTGLRVEDVCPECGTPIWPTTKEVIAWARSSANGLRYALWLMLGAVPLWVVFPPGGLVLNFASMHTLWADVRSSRPARRGHRVAAGALFLADLMVLTAGLWWTSVLVRDLVP